MKAFEIGDKVSVLDDAIDGVVMSVQKDQITIETTDGFLMTYFVNELIRNNITSSLDYFNRSETLSKKEMDLQPTKNKIKKADKTILIVILLVLIYWNTIVFLRHRSIFHN